MCLILKNARGCCVLNWEVTVKSDGEMVQMLSRSEEGQFLNQVPALHAEIMPLLKC